MWRNLQVELKLQSPSYLYFLYNIILLHLLGWAITGDGAARFSGRVEAAGREGQVWSTEWQYLHHPSTLIAMLAVNMHKGWGLLWPMMLCLRLLFVL